MSAFCQALVALGITLGGLCVDTRGTATPDLPENERGVWSFTPRSPEPEPEAPLFRPIVIHEQAAPALPPIVVQSAPPVQIIEVPAALPPAPSPYRVALEAAFSRATAPGITDVITDGAGGLAAQRTSGGAVPPLSLPHLPASLTPPGGTSSSPGGAETRERYGADNVTSGLPVDNTRILAADRYIIGILETGLNSQLDSTSGGQAIIQTTRDVFGYHGRSVLLPQGSRLICDYQSPSRQGDSRIAFSCDRVLLGGHRAEILQAGATAGDVQGRAGVAGEVDNRFWERYGTAFLLTGISTSVRFATALAASNEENNPLGTVSDRSADELSQKFGEITASVLEQTVNLAPIVTIAQGTRVQIRPAKDWYIAEWRKR